MKTLKQKSTKNVSSLQKHADILDKIDKNGTFNSCVTLKKHKENFINHPTTRPINPFKNETRRISKHILDQLSAELVSELSESESKNTISVIKLFKNINNKKLYNLLQIEIKIFYRST